jgi:hypothetical protein
VAVENLMVEQQRLMAQLASKNIQFQYFLLEERKIEEKKLQKKERNYT